MYMDTDKYTYLHDVFIWIQINARMYSKVLETYCFCISLWEIHKFKLHIYVCIDRETIQILADILRLL